MTPSQECLRHWLLDWFNDRGLGAHVHLEHQRQLAHDLAERSRCVGETSLIDAVLEVVEYVESKAWLGEKDLDLGEKIGANIRKHFRLPPADAGAWAKKRWLEGGK